jgi:hypothetical protein
LALSLATPGAFQPLGAFSVILKCELVCASLLIKELAEETWIQMKKKEGELPPDHQSNMPQKMMMMRVKKAPEMSRDPLSTA